MRTQVAWQSLLGAGAGDGAVLEDSGAGKASVAGAVLTSRRLLLLSATLTVLAVAAPPPGAPAATSLLWVGPALLFTTEAHQVCRVFTCCGSEVETWLGKQVRTVLAQVKPHPGGPAPYTLPLLL